ncbi:hypothetical protein VTK73DRAFT_143 [Phialemonium thermophilum]|uniref:Ribosome biogenesis protein Urb1 n=1 Tax=Phialemonium thermophilum TaxID=223376 RepID=A0ABR3XGP9_9PEZI
MSKRSSHGAEASEKPRKRLRVTHEPPSYEEVETSRQLRQLLTFERDAQKARHGLQSMKVLLDKLGDENDDNPQARQLLYEYLNATKPRDEESNAAYLGDIMDTWDFGGQTSNDNIMSAVPAVLALLLRVLSRDLAMVPYGLRICRTLLQKRQLELIGRNLAADKGKEFVIAPTLRLLREMVSFDGGAVARTVFRARNYTFKSLARNMTIRFLGQGLEDPKRPSTRTTAIRFFLAALRLLYPEAKRELLLQKDLVMSLTKTIKDDPPNLVAEILGTLKADVLLDNKLMRDAKTRLLNPTTLSRIASLYTYDYDTAEDEKSPTVADIAHDFLQLACTVPSAGILRQQSGFYPRETARSDSSLVESRAADVLGIENIVWMDKFKQDIPVQNTILSEFIQTLRPWSILKQAQLLVAIFRAAPELVADYFLKRRSFTFEPKLSATWIGYAALLFDTVALEIPTFFGHTGGYCPFPPPTSIVMDNILPQPLTQKVLSRCLLQKSNLISFFATRLLVAAVEKLDTAVKLHLKPRHANALLWDEAGRRLVDEFCQRSPSMKDIVDSYRSIPAEHVLHREAASRLLRLYYEVIPQVALTAKFDVSPLLAAAVRRLESFNDHDSRDRNLALVELEHLFAIARYSPGMRWFSNLEGLALCPFTTLLQLAVDTRQGLSSGKILEILDFIAESHQLVVSPEPTKSGLGPIIQSIRFVGNSSGPESIAQIWLFLDDCISRCATRPIKYIEMVGELLGDAGLATRNQATQNPKVSPLYMAILEQTPSMVQANKGKALRACAQFVSLLVGLSRLNGEDNALLDIILRKFQGSFPKDLSRDIRGTLPKGMDIGEAPFPTGKRAAGEDAGESGRPREPRPPIAGETHSLESYFTDGPVGLKLDNSALSRWSTKTVDELVEEGYAVALISLLASEHTSIRKEALVNVMKMAAKIHQSEYDEKEQCWLLLSELAESAQGNIDTAPLPTGLVSFACHALKVLQNPLHSLYPKINAFLIRGPVWRLDKLPLMHEVLQEEPSADDSYYDELGWLLSYLLDSLRTPADVASFHGKRVFERLLSIMRNPYMPTTLRKQILRILYHTTHIEGGSTTLTTRFGTMSWLESQKSCKASDAWVYEALIRRIWETVDRERVITWSKGGITTILGL